MDPAGKAIKSYTFIKLKSTSSMTLGDFLGYHEGNCGSFKNNARSCVFTWDNICNEASEGPIKTSRETYYSGGMFAFY